MREAFSDYLALNRSIRAIFVGTRRTDPHGGQLRALEPTDGGWPAFMRVHPVIEWRYADIWAVSLLAALYFASLPLPPPFDVPIFSIVEFDLTETG